MARFLRLIPVSSFGITVRGNFNLCQCGVRLFVQIYRFLSLKRALFVIIYVRKKTGACSSVGTPAPEQSSVRSREHQHFYPVHLGLWSSGTMPHSHCGDASSILARSTNKLFSDFIQNGSDNLGVPKPVFEE